MADFKLGRLKFVWKGEWTTTTTYVKDDIVEYNGQGWVCEVPHISAGFPADRDSGKWTKMSEGFSWKGAWNSGTAYQKNAVVSYLSSAWISVSDNNTNNPPLVLPATVNSNWQLYVAGYDLSYISQDIVPSVDATYDLGSPSLRFKDGYFSGNSIYLGSAKFEATGNSVSITNGDGSVVVFDQNGVAGSDLAFVGNTLTTTLSNSNLELDAAGTGKIVALTNMDIVGDLDVTGDINLGGNLTIGNNPVDTVTVQADFTSDIIPNASLSFDLGSTGQRWDNLYINKINDLLFDRVEGKTYYVTQDGDDLEPGTSIQGAFATVKKALTVATAGDTVKISSGTFTEIFPLTVPAGVSIVGVGIRGTKIVPTAGTNDKDAFLLSGESGIVDLTVADFFYDAINDTGYAFRFQSGAVITTRSPYIERVTVLCRGSSTTATDPYGFLAGDAGRGALLDGSQVTRGSLEAAMLFNECTFIVPNSRALIMTNGARSEWLTCFTYFADLAIEGVTGSAGRGGDGKTLIEFGGVSGAGFSVGETIRITSTDASSVFNLVVDSKVGDTIYIDGRVDILEGEDFTPGTGGSILGLTSGTTATSITRYDRHEFAAELRAIAGANVYGNQAVKADGDDVILQLMAWNFAYIGTGADLTNDNTAVIRANEVIELNGGRVFYNSVDEVGNFRVGDLFTVDFATGNVTFQAPEFDVTSLTGINFTDGVNTTVVNPTTVSTGNIVIGGNSITTVSGSLTLDPGGSEVINLNGSTNISGNLDVGGNVTIGGNITIGNQTLDTVTVVADFTSNLIPDADQTYDLGTGAKAWRTIYVDQVDNGQMTVKDNRIQTTVSNANLELDAAGTGSVSLLADITTPLSTFNLLDTTATTVNFAGAATAIDIGAATGTLTINNNKTVLNSTGTLQLPVGNISQRGSGVTGEVRFNTELSSFEGYANSNWQGLGGVKSVDGLTYIVPETSPAASNGELEFYAEDAAGTGSVKVTGLNRTRLTVPIATASTTTTDGALVVTGGVGIGGTVNIGTNLNVTGDVAVNGGDLTTTQTTFNLLNATATTVNFAGAATTLEIGAATGTTNINNNLDVDGDVNIDGGDLTVSGLTFNLANTNATTVNFAGAATAALNIGASTGITTVKNNLQVDADLDVRGGDITTNQTTFNLLNTTATTLNVGGAATTIGIGASTGTITLGNPTLTGTTLATFDMNGASPSIVTSSTATASVFNTNALTGNLFGAATAVTIGATTGTLNLRNATITAANATALNLNGANPGIVTTSTGIGSATGTTTIKNNLQVDGTTLFTGGVTQNGNLTVTGNLTVNGTTTTINSNTLAVDDKNIELASVASVTGITGTITSTALTTTITGLSTVAGLIPGQTVTRTAGTGAFGTDAVITSVDSSTQITVTATTNNTLGTITFTAGGATNVTANGGGITVKGATDKTIQYDNANTAWTLSEHLNLASNKQIKFNGTTVITPDIVTPANFTLGTSLSTVTIADEILVTNNLITNGDVISDDLIQNLYPDTVETINFGGAATAVNIGAVTGTTSIKNNIDISGVVRIGGDSISAKPTTSIVASGIIGNATNAGQSGQTTTTDGMNAEFEIEFEFDTGNIVRVTLLSGGKGWVANATPFVGDLLYIRGTALGGLDGGALGALPPTGNDIVIAVTAVNTPKVLPGGVGTEPSNNTGVITAFEYQGSAPILPAAGPTTFNLLNQYVETVNFASDATTIQIGAVNTLGHADGTTTIRNNATVNGDLVVNGVFTGAPGVVDTNAITLNLFDNTATTVNFAGQADTLNIGSVFGETTINNQLVVPTGIIADIKGSVFSDTSSVIVNAINGDVTSNDLQVNGSATFAFDILVQGGDLLTDQTTFNLINETATTLNIGQAATSIVAGAVTGTYQIRNATTQIDGDLAVNGGDITTNQSVFNFVTSGATTLNIGSSASVVGIGSTLGTTTVNNDLVAGENLQVDGDTVSTTNTTLNLFNTTATTVNFAGAALATNIGNSAGTVDFAGTMVNFNGDITVKGGDIITDQTSFNLLQTPTTINFADAATTLTIGAASGTTTIKNNLDVDLDLNVDGGDITSSQTTFNLLNSTVATLNLAGAGTQINIGSANGSTNVKNDLNVSGRIIVGSDDSTTSTIDSADTTFYLANTTAENLYMGGAATTVEIGSTTGTTTVNNNLTVDGQATFEQDLQLKGGDLTTNQTTFNLINAVAETVNFAGAGTTVNIGSTTGTTIVKNALQANADVEIRGGDLTTNQSTFNLVNTNATTVNFAGGANTVNIAAPGSATNIAGALNVTGITTVNNHIIPGLDVTYDLGSSTNRFRDLYLSGSTLSLGGGTISFDGTSFNFQGGTSVGQRVETSSTTFDLLNNIAQTINFGGDATVINLGALSGSTNIRHNLNVAGQLTVGSSDSSVSTLAVTDTTFFLADATAETIYFGGAATSINMGSVGGLTTVNTDLTVTGNTILEENLTVNGNLTLTSLNTSGENNDFVISPQGTGRVIIEPQGGFTLNPTTLGTINNVSIGATTRAAGRFTSLEANAQTRFTAGTSSVDSTTGTVVVQGGMGIGENLNVEGNVSANQLTLRGTVLFENELSVSSGGTGTGQFTARGILYGNSTDAIQATAGSDYETPYTGTNQQTSNAILTTNAQGVPVWTDVIDCGTF